MKQKDQIIQNILDKRYEQEKQLYILEQKLMNLGYKQQDIQGTFMLDYIDSGKYTIEMESLVSKINIGMFANTTTHRVEIFREKINRNTLTLNNVMTKQLFPIYTLSCVLLNSIGIFSLSKGEPLILPITIFMSLVTGKLTFDASLKGKELVVQIQAENDRLNQKIKEYTKVKEEALFKEYTILLQDYLSDFCKYYNIQEDLETLYQQGLENHMYMKGKLLEAFLMFKSTQQRQKALQIYRDILEEMKPINKIQKKSELVKSYTLKR